MKVNITRAARFLKTRWRGVAVVLLLLNLIIGAAMPALADVIHVQPLYSGPWEISENATQLVTADEINMQSHRIINVLDPVLDQDAATKKYVDDNAGNGTSLWEVDGSETQLITPTDIDFAKYKAIALACDNGATLPASANVGQWFLHTPTGRNILYQYDGSGWSSIISLGTMTLYVDKTDGTDDLDYGTGIDSDAFATVGYAVEDCIPGLYGGDVMVYVNDESYDETVNIGGKFPAGDYSITLVGTLSSEETITSATVYAGSGRAQGTVTKAGVFSGDDYENMLAYFVTDDTYRVIDGHTFTLGFYFGNDEPAVGDIINGDTSGTHATVVEVNLSGGSWYGGDAAGTLVLHIPTGGAFIHNEELNNETQGVGSFAFVNTAAGNSANDDTIILVGTAASSTTQNVVIYSWGTTIKRVNIHPLQANVCLDSIKLAGTTSQALYVFSTGEGQATRCWVHSTSGNPIAYILGDVSLLYSVVSTDSAREAVRVNGGRCTTSRSKLVGSAANAYLLRLYNGGVAILSAGSIIDLTSKPASSYGVHCRANSVVDCYSSAGNGYSRIRNCIIGVYAYQGGMVGSTSNNQYSDNGTDESAVAASYGYID